MQLVIAQMNADDINCLELELMNSHDPSIVRELRRIFLALVAVGVLIAILIFVLSPKTGGFILLMAAASTIIFLVIRSIFIAGQQSAGESQWTDE